MPDFEPQHPAWEARVRTSFARQSLMTTLNAELLDLTPERCSIRSTYREGSGQQHGFFHAGISSGLGDSACGYAAYTLEVDPETEGGQDSDIAVRGTQSGPATPYNSPGQP
jgi:acyl-coenzyme A thioesterase PaaI-like protein